jgi:hypothetical protein
MIVESPRHTPEKPKADSKDIDSLYNAAKDLFTVMEAGGKLIQIPKSDSIGDSYIEESIEVSGVLGKKLRLYRDRDKPIAANGTSLIEETPLQTARTDNKKHRDGNLLITIEVRDSTGNMINDFMVANSAQDRLHNRSIDGYAYDACRDEHYEDANMPRLDAKELTAQFDGLVDGSLLQ